MIEINNNGQETPEAETPTTTNKKKIYCLPMTIKIETEIEAAAYVEAENEEEAIGLLESEEFGDFLYKESTQVIPNLDVSMFSHQYDKDISDISAIDDDTELSDVSWGAEFGFDWWC